MLRDVPRDTLIDGRYRVLTRVGAGGMADVYCAVDEQLGRNVALKLLHRRFAEDREFVERFRREASSAAGLQHPNIVAVFDRGEWDGTSYIAMELVDGRTLKQIVNEEGPLDPIRAIDLVTQVLRAARFAHRRGVVHRDLKPHNVMVDAEGRAKVTDFGIAKAGASDMTQTGSIMGTAQYLSPEQAHGHAVTPQSDLYSVGIILFELLTARVPFDGESAVAIALKQVNEAPVPPSALNAHVPAELDGIVLRALEKDPARRFADADELILVLDRARAHLAAGGGAGGDGDDGGATTAFMPMGAEPAPPVAVAAVEERERRSLWPLLVGLAVLLLAGAAVAAYTLTRTDQRTVPDATGKPVTAAIAILQNAGFATQVQRTPADAPKNTVIRQSPQPGREADEGSEVTLVVSDGPGERPVPDVVGERRSRARSALRDAGFEIEERREPSDTVPQNRIVAVSPDPGTPLEVGSTVTLVVSSGTERVAVPDVTGRPRDEAEATLRDAGFQVATSEREDASATPGAVLSQDPAAGTQLAKGTTVRLVVAKEPSNVRVPDVTGADESDAVNALSDAELAPNVANREVQSPDEDGVVVDQRPAAGEEVPKDSRVTIVVGRFTPPLNPDPGTGTTPATPTTPAEPAPTTPAPPTTSNGGAQVQQ